MNMSHTLVLIKPDAVKRGLIGRIITRFEDAGLRVSAMQLFSPPDRCHILKHYESTDSWLFNVGKKTLEDYAAAGLTLEEVKRDYHGVTEELDIGHVVKQRLVDYLTHDAVVAMVVEGNMAVEKVRLLVGFTIPAKAAPGTIRGDFGYDSAVNAASHGRSIENLVHASDCEESARREIELWFGNEC
ncbi:nucleoside-diphosphate kinase [bacterium]|nr:nucleoside-diphosphate kinase [candidate division CSSED10-310 bacterium]